MLSSFAIVAEAPHAHGLIVLLTGFLLLNVPSTGKVQKFFAENNVLLLTVGITLAAVVGLSLFFVGDKDLARQWLNQYGLLALFFISILSGAMLLYFAPTESLVPLGVTLLADSATDYPTIAAVILVAVVGATIGQYALFLLAKHGGREYLLKKRWFRIDEDQLDRFDSWFQHWGRIIIPVSNALLFTRGMLTVPAGFTEMRDREFVVLSALGTLLFQTWLAAATLYAVELGFLDFL